jgi:drug/metabolite transporter (DMT)-like permease
VTFKLTPILLALRAAAFIAAAGFIAVKLTGYLISRGDLAIPPAIYGVLGCLFIWPVVSVSTRRLFHELRANAEGQLTQIAAHQLKDGESRTETVHRYPWLMRYFIAALGVYCVALPYLSAEPDKPIAVVTYGACFGLAFMALATAFYMFIYSVTLKPDGIVVNALGKRKIAFSDVKDSKVVFGPYGRQIVVGLKDGEVFRFGGKLTDFSTLWGVLSAETPHRTD